MQSHARVVVVGGGCVGASILYGLTCRGWRDVVLLERTQLTAGSTWHAAGLIPSYTRSFNTGRMFAKTIELYEALERETGQAVGWHKCGQLRIANTPERLDEFLSYLSVADAQGTRARLVSPSEIRDLWPLHESRKMLGGLYHPDDGHIAPADVTQALAKGARDRGAQIYTDTAVIGFDRLPGNEWRVRTTKGDIVCEHVVSASGNYARETCALVGLDLPAIPIVHQYWITEPIAEIRDRKAQRLREMPILRDEAIAGYIREEGDGLMFGPYERPEHLELFAVDGVPESFGADLLPEDFAAVEANWMAAAELVPALGRTGIRRNVRGPFQMTADEMPLAGPAWGLGNFWLAEGVPGGILWGGALGHYLSAWIVEGDAGIDMSEIDPRRFGDHCNKAWTKIKVKQAWGLHADVRFPYQEWSGARPQKTAPSFDRLSELGAVWGNLNGWEMPNWFAPEGVPRRDEYSFRRAKNAEHVAAEVDAVRNAVGLVEMTPMTKFEVNGRGAAAWLDRTLANRLPGNGRAALSHHLSARGTVQSEYVVCRLGDESFYLISTPRGQRLNLDLLTGTLPRDGSVTLRDASLERGCFTVVGPRSRELLQNLTELNLSNEHFPWLSARSATVGLATDVRLIRINYEGELGWELYHPICYQRHLLDELLQYGQSLGIRLVGLHALESLRLDKSYRAMYRDMNQEHTALESSLDRFLDLAKDRFSGQQALLTQKAAGLAKRLVTLQISPGDAPANSNESIYCHGRLAGRVSSGAYSYHLKADLALAFVDIEQAVSGQRLEVSIMNARREAVVIPDFPYDPSNSRIKA